MTRRWKQRIAFFTVGIVGGLGAILWWAPWEITAFPVKPPNEKAVQLAIPTEFQAGDRVTVVTAHPDDAEFYLGGTLPLIHKTGARLSLVVVTDGDKGYYPFEDSDRNRRVRRAEQTTAARAWRAHEVEFLGFPDGRVQSGDDLNRAVRDALIKLKPNIVLAFDDVYPPRRHHADHERSAEAVAAVLGDLPTVRAIGRFSTEAPNRVTDVTDTWEEKLALMKLHASQFVAPRNDFISRITGRAGNDRFDLVKNLVEHSAELDGNLIEVSLGEGLRWTEIRPANSASPRVKTKRSQ